MRGLAGTSSIGYFLIVSDEQEFGAIFPFSQSDDPVLEAEVWAGAYAEFGR